jgi:hypothetical protein
MNAIGYLLFGIDPCIWAVNREGYLRLVFQKSVYYLYRTIEMV